MRACGSCGSEHIYEYKLIRLRGQPWLVRDDGYRFYVKPAEGNPAVDREERFMFEYKHGDSPADDLAKLMFDSLPDSANEGAKA